MQIIHFVKRGKGQIVAQTDLRVFLSGRVANTRLRLVPPTDDAASKMTVREVLDRASSQLGKTNYSALKQNCEHVASFIRHGKFHSRQVRAWAELGYAALVITTAALVVRRLVSSQLHPSSSAR